MDIFSFWGGILIGWAVGSVGTAMVLMFLAGAAKLNEDN